MEDYKLEVQTRNEEGSLRYFPSIQEAMSHAKTDRTVWKISWSMPDGERVRLVLIEDCRPNWSYEPLTTS